MPNTFSAIGAMTFAAFMTTVGSAEISYAKSNKPAPETAGSVSAGSPLEQAIRASNGSDFSVVPQMGMSKSDGASVQLVTSDSQLRGIRDSISANDALMQSLGMKHVSLIDIISASRAADGSLIFYVK